MKKIKINKGEIARLIPLFTLIIVAFSVNNAFLSSGNIISMLKASGFLLIASLGFTLVLIAGGLDLSVGSMLALGGVIAGVSVHSYQMPILIAILLGCSVGLLLGTINAVAVYYFNVPPFIMTLGMLYIARGIVNIVTKGVPVYPLGEKFQSLEQGVILGIPHIVVLAFLLSILIHTILRYTRIGREIYAVGGNREAADLSGISARNVYLFVYGFCGGLAALTGIMMASRLGSAQPGVGVGFELQVAVAVIIGGSSMFGGSGNVFGTVIGALFMTVLANSMTIMKVSVYWQNFIIGIILVLAVVIDQMNRKKTGI